MLSLLKIRNFAIVEELELEFGPGLNVLTGETGAGKSIILRAIELLGGSRASGDLIRSGQKTAEIEGLFLLPKPFLQNLLADFEELETLVEDNELLVRRVIDISGKSRVYLNGRLTTAGSLQKIASRLVDITSQHEEHSLLDSAQHRNLLDSFGVSSELLFQVRQAYEEYSIAAGKLESFLKDSEAKRDYFRRIGFERDELKSAALKVGEREGLEAELNRLASFEKLSQGFSECLVILEEDTSSVDSQLRRVLTILNQALAVDPGIHEGVQLIQSAHVQIEEASRFFSQYGAGLENNPARLENLRERIAEISRLERKYGKPTGELVNYLARIQTELSEFESGDFDEAKLTAKVAELRSALLEFEEKLTQERINVGTQLSGLVESGLKKLNMEKARFQVSVLPAASSRYGKDSVEFNLAANPGEPFRHLAKVASGGELSRVLLILKTLLNEKEGPLLQIFDEVDTGIGGAVSQVVGEKLKHISSSAQVLIVTHAAQIAAFADTHLRISKTSSETSTRTVVEPLAKEERVRELARMMAGRDISEKFEDSARELITAAMNFANSNISVEAKRPPKEKSSVKSKNKQSSSLSA